MPHAALVRMLASMRLDNAAIAHLPADVPGPVYDRSAVSVGIVHVGVGGFHRSHQAMYVDRLMNAGLALDWGICGLGVLPGDRRLRDALVPQDELYTLALKPNDGSLDARVIGSIVEYIHALDEPEAAIERLASPEVRIVSLTITAFGYNIDITTRVFDETAPAIVADLADGAVPATVFGLVTEAIRRRRERGIAPFTIMSCDNFEHNGDAAQTAFVSFARLKDPELAAWIDANIPFPNSMVDRITPVTTPEDIARIADEFGIEDAWPVVAETFEQWVLEDRFVSGRPPYEDAGVTIVDDAEPYERVKLRLLNSTHQALAYLGMLAGYTYTHEVMQDPEFEAFLRRYMDDEVSPTLSGAPMDLAEYTDTLVLRFSNPAVLDTLARLGSNPSAGIPQLVLPIVRDNLAAGRDIALGAAVVASWARYAEGVDEQGGSIALPDAEPAALAEVARTQRIDLLAFLRNRELFGDLVDDAVFTAAYVHALDVLHTRGARALVGELAAR